MKMKELFRNIPSYIPIINPYDYTKKYNTTIKSEGGGWFIDNNNSDLPTIKRRWLSNK